MTTHTMTITPEALKALAEKANLADVIPDTVAANAVELDDLRSAIKTLEKREKALRAGLLDYLETIGQDAISDGSVAISLSRSNRKNIDRAKMEALYPKVLAAVETSTPVVQVRVKTKG